MASAISALATPTLAATWDAVTTAVIHTKEGVEGYTEAAGVVATDSIVTLGAEYAVNDTVTFTYDVALATNATFPATITSLVNADGATTKVAANANGYSTGATVFNVDIAGLPAGSKFKVAGDNTVYTAVSVTGTAATITPAVVTSIATAGSPAITAEADNKAVTLGLTSSDSTSGTYRVTQLGASGTTVGTRVVVPAPNVSPTGITAAAQKVGFSAATGTGIAMDALATKSQQASAVAQHGWTTGTAFDGVIDVEESRFQFTAATTTTATTDTAGARKTVDEMAYTIANTAKTDGLDTSGVVTGVAGTPTKIAIDMPYDLSWMDSDATTAGIQLTNSTDIEHTITGTAGSTAGTITLATTGDKVTISETATPPTILGQANFLSIENSIAKTAIPVATFAPTATLTYTSNGTANYTKVLSPTTAAGSWSLNGASITAFGVPFGSAVTRFLWINNAGATSGEVSGSLTLGGTTYGPYTLGTAAAKGSTEVGKLLDSALATAGVTIPESSRGNVLITVPVKAADVTMSSAYKHNADADRLTIDNSAD